MENDNSNHTMNRRHFLYTAGASILGILAGCQPTISAEYTRRNDPNAGLVELVEQGVRESSIAAPAKSLSSFNANQIAQATDLLNKDKYPADTLVYDITIRGNQVTDVQKTDLFRGSDQNKVAIMDGIRSLHAASEGFGGNSCNYALSENGNVAFMWWSHLTGYPFVPKVTETRNIEVIKNLGQDPKNPNNVLLQVRERFDYHIGNNTMMEEEKKLLRDTEEWKVRGGTITGIDEMSYINDISREVLKRYFPNIDKVMDLKVSTYKGVPSYANKDLDSVVAKEMPTVNIIGGPFNAMRIATGDYDQPRKNRYLTVMQADHDGVSWYKALGFNIDMVPSADDPNTYSTAKISTYSVSKKILAERGGNGKDRQGPASGGGRKGGGSGGGR